MTGVRSSPGRFSKHKTTFKPHSLTLTLAQQKHTFNSTQKYMNDAESTAHDLVFDERDFFAAEFTL
jgi:hypothetical protein